jgi:acetyl esterase
LLSPRVSTWLRDVGHAYAQKLAKDGNDITYVHYPELPHGFIQMTAHSKRCMEATLELARLLGEGLKKPAPKGARA